MTDLTAEEVQALRQDISSTQDASAVGVQIEPEDKNIRKKIYLVQKIVEKFSTSIDSVVTQEFHFKVKSKLDKIDVLNINDFIEKIKAFSCIVQLNWGMYGIVGYIGLDRILGFSLVEFIYGAKLENIVEPSADHQEMTPLENETIKPFLDNLNNQLFDIVFDGQGIEHTCCYMKNKLYIDAQQIGKYIVVANYNFTFGKHNASIELFLTNVVLSALENMHSQQDTDFVTQIIDNLNLTPVDVAALLGESHVYLRDLINLKVGDMLWLESNQSTPISILVEDTPKFLGTPVSHNGSIGVEITQRIA